MFDYFGLLEFLFNWIWPEIQSGGSSYNGGEKSKDEKGALKTVDSGRWAM